MNRARSAMLLGIALGLAAQATPGCARQANGTPQVAPPTPAQAKAGPIVVDTAAPWTHAPTGIVVPPAIGSFTRASVSQSSHGLADVSIGYNDNASGTALTVFVFRAGWPQAPLWADRLAQAMGMTVQRMGGTRVGTPTFTPFTPAGHASASAMRVVQSAKGGAMLATGAVVIPAGPWLVTMRMSSRTFDAATLDARLAGAAAALRVPVPAKPLPAAQPIAACADALAPPVAQRAAPWDRHAILTGTVLAATRGMAETPTGKKALGPNPQTSVLCRDPASTLARGFYRIAQDNQRYVLALGDAGVTIETGPSVIAQAFRQPAMFDVILSVFDKTLVFAPFASLPTPEQAMETAGKTKPEVEVDDNRQIVIVQ